jgi:hypothetical protein
MVVISVKGVVHLADMQECAAGIMTPATLSYRKLVDLTDVQPAMSAEDIAVLAEYVREQSGIGPMGALAITAGSDAAEEQARLFGSLAVADGPLKIFRELAAARDWLDAQPSQARQWRDAIEEDEPPCTAMA